MSYIKLKKRVKYNSLYIMRRYKYPVLAPPLYPILYSLGRNKVLSGRLDCSGNRFGIFLLSILNRDKDFNMLLKYREEESISVGFFDKTIIGCHFEKAKGKGMSIISCLSPSDSQIPRLFCGYIHLATADFYCAVYYRFLPFPIIRTKKRNFSPPSD